MEAARVYFRGLLCSALFFFRLLFSARHGWGFPFPCLFTLQTSVRLRFPCLV